MLPKADEFYTQFLWEGWGVQLQNNDPNIYGYIEKNKLKTLLKENIEYKNRFSLRKSQQQIDIYEELKENFGGKIPYEIQEAFEKDEKVQSKNLANSRPVIQYFKGEE